MSTMWKCLQSDETTSRTATTLTHKHLQGKKSRTAVAITKIDTGRKHLPSVAPVTSGDLQCDPDDGRGRSRGRRGEVGSLRKTQKAGV